MRARYSLLYPMILFGLFGSISFSVGRSTAFSSHEKKQESTRNMGQLPEKQVTEFLKAYYTFEKVNDNYAAYTDFLTAEMQTKIKAEQVKKAMSPQRFGHSRWIKSENFIEMTNDERVEVLSFVDFTTALLNEEGAIVKKEIRHRLLVKLTYRQDNHHFLLDGFEQLSCDHKNEPEVE